MPQYITEAPQSAGGLFNDKRSSNHSHMNNRSLAPPITSTKGLTQSRAQEARPVSKNLVSIYDMAMSRKDNRNKGDFNDQNNFQNGLGKSVQPLSIAQIQSKDIQRLHSSGFSPTEAKNTVGEMIKILLSKSVNILCSYSLLCQRKAIRTCLKLWCKKVRALGTKP